MRPKLKISLFPLTWPTLSKSAEWIFFYWKFAVTFFFFVLLKIPYFTWLTLEGKEVALWRLTSLSRWSKEKFKSPCNFEELPYVAAHVFSPLVNYENVDIVHVYPVSILEVIFLESNPLQFIETLFSLFKVYVYMCLTKIKLFV